MSSQNTTDYINRIKQKKSSRATAWYINKGIDTIFMSSISVIAVLIQPKTPQSATLATWQQ
jgi:hypothetical protein